MANDDDKKSYKERTADAVGDWLGTIGLIALAPSFLEHRIDRVPHLIDPINADDIHETLKLNLG